MVCTHGHDHKDANCIDEQATSKQVATLITNEVFQTQDDVSDSNQVQNTDTPEDQVTTALEQVLGFINQRISAYHKYDAAIKTFRETKDEEQYYAVCEDFMKKLQSVSLGIRALEAQLRDLFQTSSYSQADKWARHIRSIQEMEREKLQLTAQLHMLHTTYTVVKDEPWNDQYRESLQESQQELGEIVDQLNEYIDEIREAIGNI